MMLPVKKLLFPEKSAVELAGSVAGQFHFLSVEHTGGFVLVGKYM